MGIPKMQLLSQVVSAPSYAATQNARFSNAKSHYVSAMQRWQDTLKQLPANIRETINYRFISEIEEFKRRNPNIKSWNDILDLLPECKNTKMKNIFIDVTMQRILKHMWCCTIVGGFNPLKAAPIQVYRPDPTKDEYVAWDGQHTLVSLWIIAVFVLNEDPANIEVPIVVYKSTQKADMRDSFVGHNGGEYKSQLDAFDKIEQKIYGVRIDKSKNPNWIEVEEKQQVVEAHDLFLTKKDIGNAHMPGAISRMQEFEKLDKEELDWLCTYLVAVGGNTRPPGEKELVMMSYFFQQVKFSGISVNKQYISDIASVLIRRFNADFDPDSIFWTKAGLAYNQWHRKHVSGVDPRFNKEPIHGYPFLVEQLKKDLPKHSLPHSRTNSEFLPDNKDLF